MAAINVMRRYIDAVRRGDWATRFGFFADDIVLYAPGPLAARVEVWIFEANQYEVDEPFADPVDG